LLNLHSDGTASVVEREGNKRRSLHFPFALLRLRSG
jgi:hypothetical protein